MVRQFRRNLGGFGWGKVRFALRVLGIYKWCESAVHAGHTTLPPTHTHHTHTHTHTNTHTSFSMLTVFLNEVQSEGVVCTRWTYNTPPTKHTHTTRTPHTHTHTLVFLCFRYFWMKWVVCTRWTYNTPGDTYRTTWNSTRCPTWTDSGQQGK